MIANLTPFYPWLVFLHICGAFLFALAHGVSTFVAIRLGRERDRARIATLLELSAASLTSLYAGLGILLLAGVAAGIVGGHFGRLWIWVALGLLIAVVVAMYVLATTYYARLRAAVGLPSYGRPATEPASDEELDALLRSRRPGAVVVIGFGGLAILVWLMVFKPF